MSAEGHGYVEATPATSRGCMAIWQAGVLAVDRQRLVAEHVRVAGKLLYLGDEVISLDSVRRIVVVGAGKAGAGMSQGLEAALGDAVLAEKQLVGWVNVPEDCVRSLARIHLHAARPAAVNEPTSAGVAGTRRILQLAEELRRGTISASACCRVVVLHCCLLRSRASLWPTSKQ